MLTKEELNRLKEGLPKNGYRLIAKKSKKTVASVVKILNEPHRYDKNVIDCALIVVEQAKNHLQAQKSKIKAITE